MKRIVTAVAALGLVMGACGGADKDTGAGEAAEEEAAEPDTADADSDNGTADDSDDGTTATADTGNDDGDGDAGDSDGESAATDAGDDDGGTDAAAGDGDGDGDGDDSGNTRTVRSMSDVPAECRDRMAEFLHEIEPVVSPIDWQTATLDDFTTIADEFEERSDTFEERYADDGCDNLVFEADDEMQLLIEFAEEEAPGTVSFLRFLAQLGVSQDSGGSGGDAGEDDGSAGGGTAGGAFTNCAEAIDFVQDMIDTYETFGNVPGEELLKMSTLTTIYSDCSVEQLEFFNSEEMVRFLEG